jgi:hypothetical protein
MDAVSMENAIVVSPNKIVRHVSRLPIKIDQGRFAKQPKLTTHEPPQSVTKTTHIAFVVCLSCMLYMAYYWSVPWTVIVVCSFTLSLGFLIPIEWRPWYGKMTLYTIVFVIGLIPVCFSVSATWEKHEIIRDNNGQFVDYVNYGLASFTGAAVPSSSIKRVICECPTYYNDIMECRAETALNLSKCAPDYQKTSTALTFSTSEVATKKEIMVETDAQAVIEYCGQFPHNNTASALIATRDCVLWCFGRELDKFAGYDETTVAWLQVRVMQVPKLLKSISFHNQLEQAELQDSVDSYISVCLSKQVDRLTRASILGTITDELVLSSVRKHASLCYDSKIRKMDDSHGVLIGVGKGKLVEQLKVYHASWLELSHLKLMSQVRIALATLATVASIQVAVLYGPVLLSGAYMAASRVVTGVVTAVFAVDVRSLGFRGARFAYRNGFYPDLTWVPQYVVDFIVECFRA